jgi:hypothetical protein
MKTAIAPNEAIAPNDYHCSITAKVPAKEAFDNICHVAAWWTVNFEGRAQKPDDRFTVHFGETFVTFTIGQVIPDKKIVWHVLDCNLHWLNNKKEWTGTSIVWDLTPKNDSTQIDMLHVGLVPGIECFDNCQSGWNHFIKESLFQLITEHRGFPERAKQARPLP